MPLVFSTHEFQSFRRQGPIDGSLRCFDGLRLGRGLTRLHNAANGDRPFPQLPLDALNDCVIYISVSQIRSLNFENESLTRFIAGEPGFFTSTQSGDRPAQ